MTFEQRFKSILTFEMALVYFPEVTENLKTLSNVTYVTVV